MHFPSHLARSVVVAAFVVVLTTIGTIGDWYAALREQAFDRALVSILPSIEQRAIVVDIDRDTIETQGPWPWGRERIAVLAERIADAKASVLGLDIVITGPDARSPAALARQLAAETRDETFVALAGRLVDGDRQLAAALSRVPSVLGVALDPEAPAELERPTAILVPTDITLESIWQAAGVVAAPAPLQAAAAASAVVALPGDADAAVRRVPLLTLAGSNVVAGLAVEVVRVAETLPAIALSGQDQTLIIGRHRLPFPPEGLLRLVPIDDGAIAERTISASRLLIDPSVRATMTGRIVLLGSSAPEAGGLRPIGGDALGASVQLQARAVDQILAGVVPWRPAWLGLAETMAMLGLGLVAAVAGGWLRPLRASLITVAVALAWICLAAVLLRSTHLLLDPAGAPLAALAGFASAALVAAAATAKREALIRRRFEQHLAPAVVSRIVERPELLKLGGELREVTALFTDVEGFTAMTERSDPQTLVSVLDRYFETVCQCVVENGGMVDKIVGDGVHAIFNAPFDLPEHAAAAVRTGEAIIAASELFRRDAAAAAIGFGRTRIGIETGNAIVGDVGGGRKLDYTAHGDAVNAAARLEAANKVLGSQICIGPGTASRLPAGHLRPLGEIEIRGRGTPLAIYDIWPNGYSGDERKAYLAAAELARRDPAAAIAALTSFANGNGEGGDRVASCWIERLRAIKASRSTSPP